jgi:hypothetical protein
MNLKHLKLKIEALRSCDLALIDEFVKDEKRNLVLKVRLTIFTDVHRMINKSKKEVEKATKKRLKKGIISKSRSLTQGKIFKVY